MGLYQTQTGRAGSTTEYWPAVFFTLPAGGAHAPDDTDSKIYGHPHFTDIFSAQDGSRYALVYFNDAFVQQKQNDSNRLAPIKSPELTGPYMITTVYFL